MSETPINVKKRNGSLEPLNLDKINRILRWATNDLNNVSLSDIAINTKINLVDGITSREVHKVLIDSSINLFNEHSPNYQWVASRLLNYQLRKDVWGGKNAPKLYDFIKQNVDIKIYHSEILDFYTNK